MELIYSSLAVKQLKKLPKEDAKRLMAAMNEVVRMWPSRLSFMTEMVGETQTWRIRKGDWRAIFQVNEQDRQIHVLKVGHRKDIYS